MSTAQYRLQVNYSKNGALIVFPDSVASFTPLTDGVISGEIIASTIAGMIPQDGIANAGLVCIQNLGDTEMLLVGIDDTGFVEHDRLPPGQAVYRWSTDRIYFKALANTTLVRYTVIATPTA